MALAVTSAPFQQVNIPALDLRRYLGAGMTEGVVASGDMAVAQRGAGANMSVDIAAGEAYVLGESITNQGLYYAYNDAVFNLTGFTAAHATLPRIDRVALRVRDAFHGDAANDLAFVILTGTATSGATLQNLTGALTVPANHLLLANILIPATATTITTANIDTTVRLRSVTFGQAIFDETVGTAKTTFDTGAVIPASYGHLRIVYSLRCDGASDPYELTLRFNNDSGANYGAQYMRATGTTVSAAQLTGTAAHAGIVPGAAAASSYPARGEILIPNYAGATGLTRGFSAYGGYHAATDYLETVVGSWSAATVVNRVSISNSGGNFVVGSRLTIYVMGS